MDDFKWVPRIPNHFRACPTICNPIEISVGAVDYSLYALKAKTKSDFEILGRMTRNSYLGWQVLLKLVHGIPNHNYV